MKKIILAIPVIVVIGAAAFYATRPAPQIAPAIRAKGAGHSVAGMNQPAAANAVNASPALPAEKEEDKASEEFFKMMDIVVSPRATFDEKQSTWEQLRDGGQLDRAVSELEKEAKAYPDSPETITALARGYMFQAGATQNILEMGILGAKIEQSFTTALKLDPSNWDAQFFKAVSLANYPAFMKKGQETIDGFQSLIQQQETQPQQPQFSKTYVRLGEQYQKQGNGDAALQVWQRGAQLFPDSEALQEKINPQPAAQP